MIMRDLVTAKERTNFNENKLTPHYFINAKCGDCGEDIEECFFTNNKNEIVHVTTHTNGHYYNDGSVSCEGCHEGSR